jgi:hypothetical protein
LQTISLAKKANELLGSYLKTVGTTLAKYANSKQSPAAVAIFYNSDSQYSQQLKDQFTAALSQVNGKVVKEVDINAAGFDAAATIPDVTNAGAKIGFLALSKNKADQAVAIAKANKSLELIGGDELYNPAILIQGGDAIQTSCWRFPGVPSQTIHLQIKPATIWKGRVSWRTATAYDATQALATALAKILTVLEYRSNFKLVSRLRELQPILMFSMRFLWLKLFPVNMGQPDRNINSIQLSRGVSIWTKNPISPTPFPPLPNPLLRGEGKPNKYFLRGRGGKATPCATSS